MKEENIDTTFKKYEKRIWKFSNRNETLFELRKEVKQVLSEKLEEVEKEGSWKAFLAFKKWVDGDV